MTMFVGRNGSEHWLVDAPDEQDARRRIRESARLRKTNMHDGVPVEPEVTVTHDECLGVPVAHTLGRYPTKLGVAWCDLLIEQSAKVVVGCLVHAGAVELEPRA